MKQDEFIRLNFRQLVALVDLKTDYRGDDSPANDGRTRAALARRGMWDEDKITILPRGEAYLGAAEYETAWYTRHHKRKLRAA